jgi:hypothetical protein
MKNNQYDPEGSADCTLETLLAVGDTLSTCSVESAEIVELHLDEPSGSGADTPKNPILTYTEWGDNEAVLTTYKAGLSNATAGKVRFLMGTGEKPEPEVHEVTLSGGAKAVLGVPAHVCTFTVDRIDQTTYQFLRKLQKFKGVYFFRYCTDKYIYGGDNGIQGDVVKVVFAYGGGGSEPTKATITYQFKAYCEPVRDLKPW